MSSCPATILLKRPSASKCNADVNLKAKSSFMYSYLSNRLEIVNGAIVIVASFALNCGDSSIVLNSTSAHAWNELLFICHGSIINEAIWLIRDITISSVLSWVNTAVDNVWHIFSLILSEFSKSNTVNVHAAPYHDVKQLHLT